MKTEPKLASRHWTENGIRFHIVAVGGLHFIRGNKAPYFSITATITRNGRFDSGGCLHDDIAAHFPQFTDLIALHLSDIDGAPSYAIVNGWYWLSGALPGADQGAGYQYHGGNSSPERTREECLQIFADHCRVTIGEAQEILSAVRAKWNWPDMKTEAARIMEAMRPRWKREAEACIAKHGLKVFGDDWKGN